VLTKVSEEYREDREFKQTKNKTWDSIKGIREQ
jgi:hypothetical protein